MSVSSKSSASSDVPVLRFFATGAASLLVSFVVWYGIMAASLGVYYLQISRHPHEHNYHTFTTLDIDWLLPCIYVAVFFIVAVVFGGLRWSFRPVIAIPSVYGIFLLCYSSTWYWSRIFTTDKITDFACLLLPLITSAAGAFLGERLAARRCSKRSAAFE
jgi:hypothetical protein